jgi:hypothetical protein
MLVVPLQLPQLSKHDVTKIDAEVQEALPEVGSRLTSAPRLRAIANNA